MFRCAAASELDLLPFTVTFLTSFWQIQYGILGGVAVSGALLLYHTARPQIKVALGGRRRGGLVENSAPERTCAARGGLRVWLLTVQPPARVVPLNSCGHKNLCKHFSPWPGLLFFFIPFFNITALNIFPRAVCSHELQFNALGFFFFPLQLLFFSFQVTFLHICVTEVRK